MNESDYFILFIENIKKRPSMYLANKSLDNIFCLIEGYCIGAREMPLVLNEFNEYVTSKYKSPASGGWYYLIKNRDVDDDLKFFLDLWDDFIDYRNNIS